MAKTFDGRDAEVYAVPVDPPAPLFRPSVAKRVGTLAGFKDPVTGAGLSRDGRRMVVCANNAVGVYVRDPKVPDRWRAIAVRRFSGGGGIEAVAWDGEDLILAGEGRGVFRLTAFDWSGKARQATPARAPGRRP